MLARVAVVVLLLGGCATPSTSEGDESLTCDVGGSGAFGNACVKASSPIRRDAVPLATSFENTPGGMSPNYLAYGVHLVSVNGAYEGAVSFDVPVSDTYEIYLSSPNIPFRIVTGNGAVLTPSCSSTISSTECSYLRRVGTYSLPGTTAMRMEFGPTTVNYVRVFIQQRFDTPPVCTADELTEETAACEATSSADLPLNAASLTVLGNAPVLGVDSAYGVKLPAAPGGGYAGAIEIQPTVDGTYELYLGTPNIPLRLYAMNAWTPPATECSRYISSTECSKLRRGTRLALKSGWTYRLEFGPSSNSYVRVELRAPQPAQGTVKLAGVMQYPAGPASSYVTIADLNGDGALDIVDSNPDDAGLNTIEILRGDGTGAFTDVTSIPTGGPPAESVVSDFDHDGIPDIAALAWDGMGPLNEIYLKGTGSFMYTRSNWGNGTDYLTQLSGADFNEDGTLDLVAAWTDSQGTSGLGGFIITGMPAFTTLQNEPAFAADTSTAIAGDFNGDGHADVIAASASTGAMKLYFGNGTGTVTFAADISTPGTGIRQLAAFDLNGDGKSDVVALHKDNTVTVSYGMTLGFSAPTVFTLSAYMLRGIAAGDFDHDGRLDLAIGRVDYDAADHSGPAIMLAGASGFSYATTLDAPTGVGWKIEAADVNADGNIDLVSPGSDSIEVWLGTP